MWKVWNDIRLGYQVEIAWEYLSQDIWMQEMNLFVTEVKFNGNTDIWYFLCNIICSVV
jgi:hypothetical protein